MKTPKFYLLKDDDPIMKRRWVKTLNCHSMDGFYYLDRRYNRARLRYGRHLQIHQLGVRGEKAWINPDLLQFRDPYGREIRARYVKWVT